MDTVIVSIFADASIYASLVLGLWISFRILRYPDLAVEQTFGLGGAVYALVHSGVGSVFLAVAALLPLSMCLGFVCSALRNRLRVHPIIISLAAAYIYYSGYLALLGSPNRYFAESNSHPTVAVSGLTALMLLALISCLIAAISRRRCGLAVVATGCNPQLAQSCGFSPTFWQGVGLGSSFFLILLSGCLYAWRSGYTDVNSGSGLLLIGILVVVVARVLQRRVNVLKNVLVLFSCLFVYLAVLNATLFIGMPPQFLRGVTGIAILALVACVPRTREEFLRL